ncbi:hypothetical protein [Sphingobium sp. Ant17]|mgnify:CR=1 FL=1|nr:hypothetical protein [Sphingobium sp. Ant17]EXS71770.1 regulator [Sphingobium sp. Ant17]MDE0947286.1 hypothetical protein [Sphingobium sp.]
MTNQEEHITSEEARGGSKDHVVRYVLGISLVLVVIGMLVVLVL